MLGDCKTVLRALLPLIEKKSDQSFIETCQKRVKSWSELTEEQGRSSDMPMQPQALTLSPEQTPAAGRHCLGRQRHDRNLGRQLYRDPLSHAVHPVGIARTMADGLPYFSRVAQPDPGWAHVDLDGLCLARLWIEFQIRKLDPAIISVSH